MSNIVISKFLTLKEVKEETGLSSDTLRFYEKEGLLPEVEGLENAYQRYIRQEVKWIKFIICLKSTGMPLKQIKQYKELMSQGDVTAGDRKNLLIDQREIIIKNMESLKNALSTIDYKIKYYQELEETF